MTAEEARTITKAALVNYALLAKIDKEIEKAARDGKYELNYQFLDSYGYFKNISKMEYITLCDRYEKVGFKVDRELNKELYGAISLSWFGDDESVNYTSNIEEKHENYVD